MHFTLAIEKVKEIHQKWFSLEFMSILLDPERSLQIYHHQTEISSVVLEGRRRINSLISTA